MLPENYFIPTILLLSYLLGSIPFGLLLTKYLAGTDVRSIGSGNIGATNVLRTGNKKLALLTLLLDGVKGFIPVLLANHFTGDPIIIFAAAIIAVLGHIFPVWLKFKGGKGVATALGVLLAIDYVLFICVAFTWLFVAKVFRISSLSALSAFAAAPFIAFFTGKPALAGFSLVLAIILAWTHRSNIQRLSNGEEGKF